MKDMYGTVVRCLATGKICYTVREAGCVINAAKKHWHGRAEWRVKRIPKSRYFCSACRFYHVTHYASCFTP